MPAKCTAVREMKAGEALALAQKNCVHCFGLGKRQGRGGTTPTCNCVWRRVFRICFARFKSLYFAQGAPAQALHEPGISSAKNKPKLRVLAADYLADFTIVARRALGGRTLGQQVFKFHFLYAADWRLCARQLKLERGEIYHEIYRVESRIGRALYETQPFALFPLDEYFSEPLVGAVAATRKASAPSAIPVRPPLAKAA